ncbi:MAG: hypothetical protein OEY93_07655 [Anaerolineae bacterium]|nr:hypothetical protein [Anaerolineae bacterium]
MQNDNFENNNSSGIEPEELISGETEDTQPSTPPEVKTGYSEPDTKPHAHEKPQRVKKILTAIGLFLLIVLLGTAGGYLTGMSDRYGYERKIVSTQAFEQFQLGLQDMHFERYNSARQRFEYIIKIDPDFPGVAEQLSLAIQGDLKVNTPTPLPTSTLFAPTPTQDNRGNEEIFQAALILRQTEDWDNLIATLDILRKNDPAYRAVEVDAMYFTAFRNRGEKRILAEGNLEGGIFDLTQASQFGPLDNKANGYKKWAEWYITGASFWEVDWGQAVSYFELIVPVAPQLFDSEYFSAVDRLATAQLAWAVILVDEGELYLYNENWCDASDAFFTAWNYITPDPILQPTAQAAKEKCQKSK